MTPRDVSVANTGHVLQDILPGTRKYLSYIHRISDIRDIGVVMYSRISSLVLGNTVSLLYTQYQNIRDIGIAMYSRISSLVPGNCLVGGLKSTYTIYTYTVY